MDLQEKFDAACGIVHQILEERKGLLDALSQAQAAVDENQSKLNKAVSQRDEFQAMLSIAPVKKVEPEVNQQEQLMADRQAVFAAFRQIHNTWIAPQGLALLSGVDQETTAAILRRAAKLDGLPVEHNGRRGQASKYRWLGEKLPK